MYKNVTVDTGRMDVPQWRRHGDHRLVGIQIHNNGWAGEDEISSFSLDVGRIIGNCQICHFYIVVMGTFGVNISS